MSNLTDNLQALDQWALGRHSRRLVDEAINQLDCTEEERAAIRHWLRNEVYDDPIVDAVDAGHFAEAMLEVVRDQDAMEKAAPKWRRVYYTKGAGEVCQAPGCLELAGWEIKTMVESWIFIVAACDQHAGKG